MRRRRSWQTAALPAQDRRDVGAAASGVCHLRAHPTPAPARPPPPRCWSADNVTRATLPPGEKFRSGGCRPSSDQVHRTDRGATQPLRELRDQGQEKGAADRWLACPGALADKVSAAWPPAPERRAGVFRTGPRRSMHRERTAPPRPTLSLRTSACSGHCRGPRSLSTRSSLLLFCGCAASY